MKVTMRGVNTVKAGGKVYYYHRATGTRLKGEKGSPEFHASYAEAEKSLFRNKTETLATLLSDFRRTAKWRDKLAASTKVEYDRIFGVIEKKYGTVPYGALQEKEFRRDVLRWRDDYAAKHPREADNRVIVLARILSWAAADGPLDRNVLENVERVYQSDRSEKIWLPADVEKFCAVASRELQWALMLALHTGQRQGDLVRLTWSNYDGSAISLRQGKTAARVVVPCTKALKAMLDGMERRQMVILTTSRGRPWAGKNLQHRWKAAMEKAGLNDLHFHDLRGTAVTMLSEADCTPQQIAAITGHSLRSVTQILDLYLARTRALAESAIVKLENAPETSVAKTAAKFHKGTGAK